MIAENKIFKLLKLDRLFDSVSNYVEARLRLFKLEMGEILVDSSVKFLEWLVIATFIAIGLFFLSLAASIYIGYLLDNYSLGFLIIGAVYILMGVFVFFTWDHLGLKEKIYNYLAQKLKTENDDE